MIIGRKILYEELHMRRLAGAPHSDIAYSDHRHIETLRRQYAEVETFIAYIGHSPVDPRQGREYAGNRRIIFRTCLSHFVFNFLFFGQGFLTLTF